VSDAASRSPAAEEAAAVVLVGRTAATLASTHDDIAALGGRVATAIRTVLGED
jgi:hypothetical protein